MSTDLIVFLLAQLALDEAAAKAAVHRAFRQWHAEPWHDGETLRDGRTERSDVWGSTGYQVTGNGALQTVTAAHIARHDPARVLREVAAKRAILAEHGPSRRDASRCRVCTAIAHTGMGHADARRFRAPCPTLLFLAAVYSDHPDYRAEWAVSPVG